MKHTNFLCLGLCFLLFVMMACSSGTSKEQIYGALNPPKNLQRLEKEAVAYAHKIVNEEFAFDAVFDKKTLVVDTTLVAKRFKIYEKFSSGETRKNFYNYTIYVQKFERGWAYGALIVENAYRDIELKQHGPMKQIEQELMYQSSIFYIGDVKCEIIKHLEPNYIVIYTLHRLPRYSIVQANELYKDTYDHVIFTTDPNPSHEEYLRIMNKQNLVTDLENNKVSTYDEYKSIEK